MRLLMTDLDSTLIYSHRHEPPGKIVWVEQLHGHPQSYMTEKTWSYFQNQRQLRVIPVTTRTRAQYARLEESLGTLGWHTALICNGAIQLRDGKEVPEWTEGSRELIADDLPAWEAMLAWAKETFGEEQVTAEEPFLFYIRVAGVRAESAQHVTKQGGITEDQVRAESAQHVTKQGRLTEDLVRAVEMLARKMADPCHIRICRDARKVYVLPLSLDKGRMARRFAALSGEDSFLAAGDSELDLPMLHAAAVGFYPAEIGKNSGTGSGTDLRTGSGTDSGTDSGTGSGTDSRPDRRYEECGGFFSDTLCEKLTSLICGDEKEKPR